MSRTIRILFLFLLITSSTVAFAQAEEKSFTAEYVYSAGKLDNRASARTLALEGVKDRLWKELWNDLDETATVKHLKLTAEQMSALVPVLAKIRVVEEKCNGRTCRVKADLSADSDGLQRTLQILRKDETRVRDLLESRKAREELLGEMTVLREEAAATPGRAKKSVIVEYRSLEKQLRVSNLLLEGYIADSSGKWAEAKKAYDAALKLNAGNETVLYRRSVVLIQLGQRGEAIRDLTQVLKINPENESALYTRGVVYAGMGRYRQAVADFSRALEIDDRLSQAYYQRGVALDRMGKPSQAIRDLTRAIELNPEDSQAYLERGAIYSKLGRSSEASLDLAKAVRLDQKHDLTAPLPPSRGKVGNGFRIVKELDEAIARNPASAEAYYRRGMTYDNMGDYQAALKDFNKAIELNPKDAASYFMRGVTYGMVDVSYDSLKDIRVSARLGYKPAQQYMSARGLQW
jgi:tetratricopeptide (TPR) repeat protein